MAGISFRSIFRAGAALTVVTLAGAASWAIAQQAAPQPAPASSPAVAPATQPGAAVHPLASVPAASKPAATAKSPQKALDKPLWHMLTPPQQLALDPLKGEWDKMDAIRKQKWLEIANRFSSMKPDEQQRVHERMRDWIKLTPDERRVARENYTRTKKIEPGQKTAQWEQYQQLPEEEKKKLAADAATKKQVTNLPTTAQANAKKVAPIKQATSTCPAGTVKNTAASAPPCVPAPAPAPVPVTTTPGAAPAAPVPNVK